MYSARRLITAGLLMTAIASSLPIHAQRPDQGLLKALQGGGYVVLMRHAASPRTGPDQATANADNQARERQLDETGRNTATAMGKALRELKIPVGRVLSSPTYRALETVKYAQLPTPKTYEQLGDGGHSMAPTDQSQATWLQQQAAQFPKGSNTVIVTHFPNINAAFPQYAKDLADGEALVLGPDGKGGSALVARVKIEEWGKFAK